MFSIRYSRRLAERSAFDLHYTLDVMPVVRLSYPEDINRRPSVGGMGAAPLGVEFRFRPGKRLQPTASIRGGFAYFDTDVPERGKRLNLSADAGAGLRIRIRPPLGVHLGYRYYHLSNAYRGSVNPGFDSHLLVFGFGVAP